MSYQNEELSQFLSSYFHQDIETPLQGLEEFLQESNIDTRKQVIDTLNQFLSDNISEKEKEDFIKNHCELNFNHLNMKALEWLDGLYKTLKSI